MRHLPDRYKSTKVTTRSAAGKQTTFTYGYDDLYRLTSETVGSDPRGNNGQVTYTLDNVGNRLQRSSTLPAVVLTGLLSYDANDRVSTDSYDANGNTIQNSGQTNV